MIQRHPLGTQLYLYSNRARGRADQLLISAHGCFFTDRTSRLHLPGESICVPAGTTLLFFSAHGQPAINAGINGYLNEFVLPRETVAGGQTVYNYRLNKYEDDEAELRRALGQPREASFDVITVRNRWSNRHLGTSLADVLALLARQARRYARIHCAFCRVPGWGGD